MNERTFISSPPPQVGRTGFTRQAILDASAELFLRQGYHGTSMRQIAQQTGITPAAIYNHFATKESIFAELLLVFSPHAAVTGALHETQGRTTHDLVLDGLQRMYRALDQTGTGFRLLVIELIEFRGDHAGRMAQAFLPRVMAFVSLLQRSSPGLRSLPPILVARTFLGLFLSYAVSSALLERLPGFEASPEDLPQLAGIFLEGVGARAQRGA